MQHGSIFRDVDFLATEHGLDPRPQTGFIRQLQQQFDRFVCDAILRVIQKKPGGLGGHALTALWVGGEQFSQMQPFDFLVMRRECLPG